MPLTCDVLQDNPSSTNILAVDINAPTFNGVLSYAALTGAPVNITTAPLDQRNGDWVEQTNPSIVPFATGTRNPFEVNVGKNGNVMVTINGPNFNFGASMTGVDANMEPMTAPDPETSDAVYINLKEVWPSSLCFLVGSLLACPQHIAHYWAVHQRSSWSLLDCQDGLWP